MSLEIRPYRPEEAADFMRVPSVVFGNYGSEQRPPEEAMREFPPEWSLGAFDDGTLTTTYGAYPLVMRLNGGKAPVAGVTFVGTLPWFRRRGHLRAIMEHDFKRRYEQRMEPIAALLASIAAIYQRYGYAIVSSRYGYSVDPRWINIAPSLPKPRGSWREASKDELPLLQSMYREYSAPRNGYLHRGPQTWDMQVLATRTNPGGGPDVGPSLIAVYEEGGKPQAYVAYGARWRAQDEDGAGAGQRVVVRDWVYHTDDAYRAIWEFLKRFDLAIRVQVLAAPMDDPAFDIMLDPRELNAKRGDHLLGRIIDIERALPLRKYSGEGRVVLDVTDAMCPWNAGRWALETGPEGATIERTKDAPDLSLDVSALAQLMWGQTSPTQAVRIGRAEASRNAPLPVLDAMFRTDYAPFCPDGF